MTEADRRKEQKREKRMKTIARTNKKKAMFEAGSAWDS